jgi:hypothetical protein
MSDDIVVEIGGRLWRGSYWIDSQGEIEFNGWPAEEGERP